MSVALRHAETLHFPPHSDTTKRKRHAAGCLAIFQEAHPRTEKTRPDDRGSREVQTSRFAWHRDVRRVFRLPRLVID